MDTIKITFVIIGVLLAALSVNTKAFADSEQNSPTKAAIKINDLLTVDDQHLNAIEKAISGRHASTILNLEAVLKQTIDDPAKKKAATVAIVLLGRFRAAHAVSLLVDHIDFSPDVADSDVDSYNYHYPCAKALSNIGTPALDAVLEKGISANKNLVVRLCASVIVNVLGKPLAIEYLRQKKQSSTEPGTIAGLEELQNVAKECQPTDADSGGAEDSM